MSTEVWLRGPIDGIAPALQPVAHALLQAQEDVSELVPDVSTSLLWRDEGAATAGFHLLHLAGALDRLFTYARGEALNETQKAAARAEAVHHLDRDGASLRHQVEAQIARALDQLRATDPATLLDERRVGRAGLPSTVIGLLFHAAEHTTRHAGQFITTVKLLQARN